MSLFHREHRYDHEHAERPEDAVSFDVPGDDGVLRRYPREAFDMIVVTQDPAEVASQLQRGWLVLDERSVSPSGRPLSGDDLIVGIEGLHVGGAPGFDQPADVTEYTIGILADGARGETVE